MKIKIALSALLLLSLSPILADTISKKSPDKTINVKQELADQLGVAAFGAFAASILAFPKFTALSIIPFIAAYCANTLDKRDQLMLKTYLKEKAQLDQTLKAIKQKQEIRQTTAGKTIDILTMPFSLFTPITEMREKVVIQKQQEQLEKRYQSAYNRQISTPNIVDSMTQPHNVNLGGLIDPW